MDIEAARRLAATFVDRAEFFPDMGLDADGGLAPVIKGLLARPDLFDFSMGFLNGLVALAEDAGPDSDISPERLAREVCRRMGVFGNAP